MITMKGAIEDPTVRSLILLGVVVLAFSVIAGSSGISFNLATLFSVLQNFATVGLVALGLGLTMLIREFDISVAGMFSLGGIVAVLLGNGDPALGLLGAVGLGLVGGLTQAFFMIYLGLGSVPVTLGGLLTFGGLAIVLSNNRSIAFTNLDLALSINSPILGVFSVRSLVTFIVFIAVAVFISYTRFGRDVVATGSNRKASRVAGVNTNAILAGTFAASGALAALGGALLSFGLAAASPTGLTSIIIPAIAAVILGGGSLAGGTGLPLGIAAGVLILSLLRTGMTVLGLPSHVHEIVTGLLLVVVAVVDGDSTKQRMYELSRVFRRVKPG